MSKMMKGGGRGGGGGGGCIMVIQWVCVILMLVVSVKCEGNPEIDALLALKASLTDPTGVMGSWDPNVVDPCTYANLICDSESHVVLLNLMQFNLSGQIVPDLQNLQRLQYLMLNKNNIQGSIPPELGNLNNLFSMDLSHNNISGIIPPEFAKLTTVRFVRLNNNKLSGPIPNELTNLSKLKILNVADNNLSGKIPTTGPFVNIPRACFQNNPGLEIPHVIGLGANDTNSERH